MPRSIILKKDKKFVDLMEGLAYQAESLPNDIDYQIKFLNLGSAKHTDLSEFFFSGTKPSIAFEQERKMVRNRELFNIGKHNYIPLILQFKDTETEIVSRIVGEQIQKQLDANGNDNKYKFDVFIEGNYMSFKIEDAHFGSVEFIDDETHGNIISVLVVYKNAEVEDLSKKLDEKYGVYL